MAKEKFERSKPHVNICLLYTSFKDKCEYTYCIRISEVMVDGFL